LSSNADEKNKMPVPILFEIVNCFIYSSHIADLYYLRNIHFQFMQRYFFPVIIYLSQFSWASYRMTDLN